MVIADTLVSFGQKFLEFGQYLIQTFGYIGIFLVAFIGTSTIILPTFPLSILVFFTGSILNPFFVGIAAGLGSATGELIGYGVGIGGKKVLLKKYKKSIERTEKLFQKYRGEVVIFLIATIPIIPFDVIGLFCGIIGFKWKRFYIAVLLGKTLRYLIIAFAGFYGLSWLATYL